MRKLRQGKNIKLNAVFLPSSYRRRGPVYNKASTASNAVDVSGGILDSQQSLADVFHNCSPTRTPVSITEGETRSPSPLSPLAEGDTKFQFSPAITPTQRSTESDPADPSPVVSVSPVESNAASDVAPALLAASAPASAASAELPADVREAIDEMLHRQREYKIAPPVVLNRHTDWDRLPCR